MDIQAVVVGAIGAAAVTGGFWAAGKYGPALVVGRLHDLFEQAKDNPWMRDPSKPHRARLLLAVAEFLEEEVPNPGEGQELYDALGAQIAAHTRVGALQVGSSAQWAKVVRQFGDAVDTELDAEIQELAAPPAPASEAPAPDAPPAP